MKFQNHLNFLFSKQKEESNFNKAIYYTASNLSNTNNPDIDDILKNICAYTGLDRISIYILDDNTIKLDKSLNLTTQKNDLPTLITLDKNTINSLKIIKDVFIHDELGNTPIVNVLKSNIHHSFVYIPIFSQNNDFFGFFLFESINKPKKWDYENFKILKILSYSYSSFIGRKRAEELAEHTAKLSALGEISAGIAHEINNPLAIIHGQSNILKFLIEDAKKSGSHISLEDLQETNNLLLETVERTDKILNGLRYFVRNDENNPFVKTDIDNILDTVQILSIDRCKKSGIIVSLDRGNIPNLFELECKPTQIAQVIINLINNSFDAINLLEQTNEKWIKIRTELKNDLLHISVIDSGNGISQEMGDKILQKFYTTKKYSKFSGSGIGLNISKRIVEMHHGTMTIDYTHQNTKFDVILPLTQPI
jgi:signal transduction histidine kinase